MPHVPPDFTLPPLTAEQADAVLHVLGEIQLLIWNAYETQLVDLALRQLQRPLDSSTEGREYDSVNVDDCDDPPI